MDSKKNIIILFFILLSVEVSFVSADVACSAGTLKTFTGNPDYAWVVQASPQWLRIGNGNTGVDTCACILLDMGSVKNVTQIIFQNCPQTTGDQIRYVEVYAADETAPAFDPLDQSKYTLWLYGDFVQGYTYNADTQITADVIDVSKRYLLIVIKDHANGWTLDAAHWYASLGNIFVSDAPKLTTFDESIDTISWLGGLGSPQDSYIRVMNGNTAENSTADILVDCGTVRTVSQFVITNKNVYSGSQPRYIEVSVADETDQSFDPYDISKYTRWVYGNYATPSTQETGSYDANRDRIVDIIDVKGRYFHIKFIDHANGWPLNDGNSYVDFGRIIPVETPTLLTFAGSPDTIQRLKGLGSPHDEYVRVMNGNTTENTTADILVDCGTAKNITHFSITNKNLFTGYQPRYVEVYVADEADPNFEPYDANCYNTWLYGNYAEPYYYPDSYVANQERLVDIIDTTKRYFLIRFLDHANGQTLNAGYPYVDFGNINTIEEPVLCPAWYDSTSWDSGISNLADVGVKKMMPYTGQDFNDANLSHYLAIAQAEGVGIIFDIQWLVGCRNHTEPNLVRLEEIVETYHDNSAIVGWYIADEPYPHNPAIGGEPNVTKCENAYNIIKEYSNKPVYVTFNLADIDGDSPYNFRNAYDVMIIDEYPFYMDEVTEFNSIESWRNLWGRAIEEAEACDKRLIGAIQGFGNAFPGVFYNRLPTYNETRFSVFYSLLSGCENIIFWSYYRLLDSPATDDLYPYDGYEWFNGEGSYVGGNAAVAVPIIEELALYHDAMNSPVLTGAITGFSDGIVGEVRHDPYTNKYYFLSMNTNGSSVNATFTITLSNGWSHLVPLYGSGGNVSITYNQFNVSYNAYQVKNFELVHAVQAVNPSPAINATNVSITPTLSWKKSNDAISHDVYFGTSFSDVDIADHSSAQYKGNQTGTTTTYDPCMLTNNTTYYWRIDEIGYGSIVKGTVWSFTTVKAAPIYQAAGTAQSDTGSITVPWPTHQIGDVALLFIESCGGQAANIDPSADFATVAGSPQATGTTTNGTRITVYWCRATSSSMNSPVVTDPGNHVYGRIITFRGCVASGDPWDIVNGGYKSSVSSTTTFGSVTTTTPNTLVVLAASRDNDSASAAWSSWSNTNLAGLTERSDGGTSYNNGGGIGVATGVKATAGSVGPSTATVTSSVDGHMTIALKP